MVKEKVILKIWHTPGQNARVPRITLETEATSLYHSMAFQVAARAGVIADMFDCFGYQKSDVFPIEMPMILLLLQGLLWFVPAISVFVCCFFAVERFVDLSKRMAGAMDWKSARQRSLRPFGCEKLRSENTGSFW